VEHLSIILHPEAVNEYLVEHKLEQDSVPIDALLLQEEGTSSGRACVMLVFVLPDGRKVLAKTTFQLLNAAVRGCRGALESRGLWEREQLD
jgi:hypothetical protein